MVKMRPFCVAYGLRDRYLPKFMINRVQYSEITAMVSASPATMDDLL